MKNGFKKAGITSAVENGIEALETAESIEEDPFNSGRDWNDQTDEEQ